MFLRKLPRIAIGLPMRKTGDDFTRTELGKMPRFLESRKSENPIRGISIKTLLMIVALILLPRRNMRVGTDKARFS